MNEDHSADHSNSHFLFRDAAGQKKLLTNDPLTGLPLIPATDSGNHVPNVAYTYNEPVQMPGAQICKSKSRVIFIRFTTLK